MVFELYANIYNTEFKIRNISITIYRYFRHFLGEHPSHLYYQSTSKMLSFHNRLNCFSFSTVSCIYIYKEYKVLWILHLLTLQYNLEILLRLLQNQYSFFWFWRAFLLVKRWFVSSFGLLLIKVLWMFIWKFLCEYSISIFLKWNSWSYGMSDDFTYIHMYIWWLM